DSNTNCSNTTEGINHLLDKILTSMLKSPWMCLYDKLCPKNRITSNPIENACSPTQVNSFVKDVICELVPNKLWGSMHNKGVIMETIKQFIGLSDVNGAKLLFHEIMAKIRTNSWLKETLKYTDVERRQ